MRKVTLILSLVFTLTLFVSPFAVGQTVAYENLVKRDGLYYKKFSDVPFTGKVTGQRNGSFKDGKKVGPWVYYYSNGQLMAKGTYKNGKKHGVNVVYYDNGQLSDKITFKDGKPNGLWVSYHENGKLMTKGTYKNGKEDGPYVRYHENGSLEFQGTFNNGVQVK